MTMTRESFLRKLVDLLVEIEQGMMASEEPLPEATDKYVADAILLFGKDALPLLHNAAVSLSYGQMYKGRILDLIGTIGDISSIPLLIKAHRNASYLTGAAALQALHKLNASESYEYANQLLIDYMQGNKFIVNSSFEVLIACDMLGDWDNHLMAVATLQEAINIRNVAGMPDAAISALAKHQNTHP